MMKWIPTNVDMPPEGEYVLVTIIYETQYESSRYVAEARQYDGYAWYDLDDVELDEYEVLAWMPLPEPYNPSSPPPPPPAAP